MQGVAMATRLAAPRFSSKLPEERAFAAAERLTGVLPDVGSGPAPLGTLIRLVNVIQAG
jgi:hypothetical protein